MAAASGLCSPQFQQHGGRHFRKRRAAPPTAGFGPRGPHLRRIGQTERGAIQRRQPPPAPERVGVRDGRAGLQHPTHQFGEDLPRQPLAAIRPRAVRQRGSKQLCEMFGQGAGPLHHMIGQGGQHVVQRDARLAPPAARHRGQSGRAHEAIPRAQKAPRQRWRGATLSPGMCVHSQDTYSNYNSCTREISHRRISERHCS